MVGCWPKRNWIYLVSLMLLLTGSIILAASVGTVSIPADVVARIFFKGMSGFGSGGWPEVYEVILLKIRFPRVILAAMVGMALAVSGVAFQGIFKNPMADPYIIGVSSGAALGATIAILLLGGWVGIFGFSLVPLLAFSGAVVTTLLVYNLARVGSRVPVTTLLLAGIAVGTFLSAITSFLMVLGGKDLHAIIFWLMGGFSAKNWDHVKAVAPFIFLGLPISLVYSRDLNLLLLGEERARQLGVKAESLKKILITVASLLAASAVAVSGIVGFVGLIIPHMVRLVTGPDHRILIPCSALFGASFVILTDLLARTLMSPTEIPLGIITALFGAPFFIYLLKRGGKATF